MIYNVNERPPFGKLLLFSIQMVLSVFCATALIASICGVNMSAALVGAGLSTIVYGWITKGQSPMFISNSGNYVVPVLTALGIAGYTGVAIGGLTACIVYCIFGIIFTKIPVNSIYKIFPKALIGSVCTVVGLNLMSFIPTYVQVNGETSQWGMVIALLTMFIIAVVSHYAKGTLSLLPFLVGVGISYIICATFTLTGVCPLIDFSVFKNIGIFCLPEFASSKFTAVTISQVIPIIVLYIAYTISAQMECLSDHAALSNVIGEDLYEKPGIGRIFIGEGVANLVSSCFGALNCCSYGESIGAINVSKVASYVVTNVAAIMLALLGFIAPVQAFIASIPSCIFGGCSMILYGFIAVSGIKMLKNVDLDIQKNLIIVSVVLSIGVSGVIVGGTILSFSGTALALIIGIILNLILKEKN